jgi:hypothetical protein
MDRIARFLSSQTNTLIIEFVPPQDPAALLLVQQKEKEPTSYDAKHFEEVFETYFTINEKVALHDSVRSLYVMQTRKTS